MATAVHQLLPVFSYGDAIGAATLRTQVMLRELGFESETFAEVIDHRLAQRARPAAELPSSLRSGDVVLYRLSIGSPLAGLVERCAPRLVVVYHNITPVRYFAGTNPRVTFWLERGRSDLRRLAPRADLVIGDSTYNLDEAMRAGARHGVVVPPPVDVERLHPRASAPSAPPTVLFVGRIAPNKSIDTLLRALAALRATALPDARLSLVGTGDDTNTYVRGLRDLASRLDLDGAVDLGATRVDDATLGDAYASAAVYATASEHEGFCVPLVEAMAFGLPVLALAAGAVPETAAGAALLLEDHDPLLWAAALARVITDGGLRDHLRSRGVERLQSLNAEALRESLGDALRGAGITAQSATA
jgi:glycosyltransferase involved in cell wall biosynthesis